MTPYMNSMLGYLLIFEVGTPRSETINSKYELFYLLNKILHLLEMLSL